MAFQKIQLKPGVDRENTDYANQGRWYYCDKIRFRSGTPEKIGGWVKYTTTAFVGTCRALFNWVTLASDNLMAIGTNLKYYIERGYTPNDITPIRLTAALGADPFATTSGSTTVTVTHAAHGAMNGDYVTYSGATGFNGLAAGDLNIEFAITYLTVNTYTITVGVTPNASSSGGGAGVSAAYQISVGQSVATTQNGWGAGAWGRSTWGSGTTIGFTSQLRVWSQANFGEDLVFCPSGGAIYYWDATGGVGTRAVNLTAVSGADATPTVASSVLFTEDRHLVALGCNAIGSSTQDPMFIRWADQESLTAWTPTVQNTAGGYRLTAGTAIVASLKTRQEVLIWTDSSLYSMQFLGPPYTFGFQFISQNVSCAGPMCMALAGDKVFWMGNSKFYIYDGRVNTLRCDLKEYVFSDINVVQFMQVYAGTNERFNEVIWFYCSASSSVIDRYVIYNYVEDIWYYGTMDRTAWVDAPLRTWPTAASQDGYLYSHEYGVDDGSTTPASGISAYIQSADFEIGNGESLMFIKRLIPDCSFTGSTATSPAVTMTVATRTSPGSSYSDSAASSVTRTSTSPVEQFTEQVWVRLRGRQGYFKIASTAAGVQWQLGTSRLEIQPDGRRR